MEENFCIASFRSRQQVMHFERALRRAGGSCRAWHPGLYRQMARATAGVCLELETDGRELALELAVDGEPRATRTLLQALGPEAADAAHDQLSADVDGRHGELGMPEEILSRQAIPATGLALNIRGEVTAERLDILRTADGIYRRLMQEGNQIRRLGTLYTNLEPVGNYYSIILNALTTSDIGLPRAARVPYDILESAMEEIQAACPKVRRVVYNLSPNPTI